MIPRLRLHEFARRGEAYHFARVSFFAPPATTVHRHDFYEVFWVEHGRGTHLVNGLRRELHPGGASASAPRRAWIPHPRGAITHQQRRLCRPDLAGLAPPLFRGPARFLRRAHHRPRAQGLRAARRRAGFCCRRSGRGIAHATLDRAFPDGSHLPPPVRAETPEKSAALPGLAGGRVPPASAQQGLCRRRAGLCPPGWPLPRAPRPASPPPYRQDSHRARQRSPPRPCRRGALEWQSPHRRDRPRLRAGKSLTSTASSIAGTTHHALPAYAPASSAYCWLNRHCPSQAPVDSRISGVNPTCCHGAGQ